MDKQHENNNAWWRPAMHLFAQISAWIVGPIVVALFLGAWLDDKYNDGQSFYFYICIAVAFLITNIGLVINVIKAAKTMEKEDKKNQEQSK